MTGLGPLLLAGAGVAAGNRPVELEVRPTMDVQAGESRCPERALPLRRGRTRQGLTFQIEADPPTFAQTAPAPATRDAAGFLLTDEPKVMLRIVLANRTRSTHHLGFVDSCLFGVELRGPRGERVQSPDLVFGCLAAAHSLQLRPGERTSWNVEWTARGGDARPLPAGRYAVSARLNSSSCRSGDDPPDVTEPVFVEIRAPR